MVTRQTSSVSWAERDAAVVWHGFTQMSCYTENAPVIVERAEGRELIDVDGRRYLDAISSLWVTTLGHRVPELDAAVRRSAERRVGKECSGRVGVWRGVDGKCAE